MIKRVVILQPSYMPYPGYFDQINKSNIFIYLDDVLYTKNDWRNRNRIKSLNGPIWLTIPVDIKNRITKQLLIKDAIITNPIFGKDHLKTIELNYKKSSYFNQFFPVLKSILNNSHHLLSNLNIELTNKIVQFLEINHVKFYRSSTLNIKFKDPTDRLIQICKYFKATHYLTGNNAKNYLKEDYFANNNIVLEYQNYRHPIYIQLWGQFIPCLSIIDLLFNEGPKSLNILSNQH